MGIPTPEEFKNKLTISWGLAVAYSVVLVMAAYTFGAMYDNDKQRDELKANYDQQLRDLRNHYDQQIEKLEAFVLAEIGGARADCDRRYVEVVNPRLNKLEK